MNVRSLLFWILLIGCGSKQPPGIPPGTVVTPPDPPAKKKGGSPRVVATVSTPAPAPNPVSASFIDIKEKKSVDHVACETRAVVMVKGKATAAGENLGVGDVFMAQGKGSWDLSGDGTAVMAVMQPASCDASTLAPIAKKVVRAAKEPLSVYPNGALKVWLDVEGGGLASIGRLEGTAAVPEHVHETSWETLCAVEAKGTLMLAGSPQAIGPKTCTSVPPNTKHAWNPDAGSKLVAVQLYAPPGPEQRFKTMAADAKDAGAPLAAKPDAGPAAPKPDSGAPAPKR